MLAALLLVTIDSRGEGGPVAALQRGAQAVFGPVQDGFVRLVRPVGSFLSSIGDLGQLRDENRRLREEIAGLREFRTSVADLRRENAELRALLEMAERLQLVTTGARVIAAPPASFEWTVLIDAGAGRGIVEGMAVVNADGFVGRVIEVTPDRSRVLLASSPEAGFAVRIAETRAQGLLSGQGGQPLRLELLDATEEVPDGAEVVTQAFQGTSIPDGLPVGVVTDVSGSGGRRVLEVRPYVDFARLGTVLVVLNAPREPEELPADRVIPNVLAPRPPAPEQVVPTSPATATPDPGG